LLVPPVARGISHSITKGVRTICEVIQSEPRKGAVYEILTPWSLSVFRSDVCLNLVGSSSQRGSTREFTRTLVDWPRRVVHVRSFLVTIQYSQTYALILSIFGITCLQVRFTFKRPFGPTIKPSSSGLLVLHKILFS
jgi:hypothetical protein